jgi:acyl carrier protein
MMDRLISLFAEELDVDASTLNDESSPDSVESWDSLAAMRLVAAIEAEFNIRLSARDAMRMKTIGIARSVLKDKAVDLQ